MAYDIYTVATLWSCYPDSNWEFPSLKGYVLFINAVNEVTRKNAQSFLEPQHIDKIAGAYAAFTSDGDIAKKVSIREIEKNNFSLSLPLYVTLPDDRETVITSVQDQYSAWVESSRELNDSLTALTTLLGKEG